MNVGYHSALRGARAIRAWYRASLPTIARRPIDQRIPLPIEAYAFSCERDLPEQVMSIRSFIKYAGIPNRFVVVSDGSLTPNSCGVLKSIHPSVEVISYQDVMKTSLPACVVGYAETKPLGKKLAVEMSLPVNGTTLLTDADVLFFQGTSILRKCLSCPEARAWYLPDTIPSLDERLLRCNSEYERPVNAGFMMLKQPLEWNTAVERLAELDDAPHYFTEQTMVHIAMHRTHARPLDAAKFVLKIDDQFSFYDKYAGKGIALRHYVSTIRHKFWLQVAREEFTSFPVRLGHLSDARLYG